ncbi:molybdenum cofactor biosynthesis protein C [Enterococcus moraviensis ATCC BAA-383]|uniref:Cyclic pyranopterin monophosphate synthase n=1 Tax=Enterococcus moraviensis ATCC BAA-383 TaxID=1158609 RepID=R2TR72_9ENTE|nr:cyclic pyranopterin monophosphate synthase MoaC [Enterococcus moraviensis]EOI02682.1 molybdenum cofactor biosynthesis protein C [Enterococcus moraviensis ATCC BAA-383]EOT73941.1 molybdenum cofactor biosynthesis protein C [Enterococcus moraviensis ATCC BAA-383]OJG66146.1 molybdenum cofactor biosynthesis protein C [Enterococcus moraviensis]
MEENLQFTHINEQGEARMVDVSKKEATERTAIAYGEIQMNKEVAAGIKNQTIKKGEVLQVARVAGIMAAKKTFELIPLCHVIALTKCVIDFSWKSDQILSVQCVTKTVGPTGVEMEALTGANIALLTIYDMCKAMDREMNISNVCLLEKSGGKSGHFISRNQEVNE